MIAYLEKSAFLFDLDGTLVDSSGLHERVFREVLREYAPERLHAFDYEKLKGQPTSDSFRSVGIGGARLNTLVTEKQHRYRAAVHSGQLRLMPGAREILQFLTLQGTRLFVVSGGSRNSVEAALNTTRIHDFFEGVITADDVVRGKPAPDSFLLCMERFNLRVTEAIAVEDAISGVAACQAAALDVVVVNNPVLQEQFQHSFRTLVEFRLAMLQEREYAYAY